MLSQQKKTKPLEPLPYSSTNTISNLQISNHHHHTDIHHPFIRSIPKWEEYYKFDANEISLKNSKSMRITSIQVKELRNDLRKSVAIYNWTSPNTLEVFFECCSRIHNSTVENIALTIAKYLPHLHSLSFDFNYCLDIRNEGIEVFMKHISRSIGTNLTSFKISLVNCLNITDQGFKVIVTEIGKNFMNLKHLYMDFSR